MKLSCVLALAALPLLLTACASTPERVVFHTTDDLALVVESFDNNTAQLIYPSQTGKAKSAEILDQAKKLARHDTAVIILENYPELEPGILFRDRSMGWFIGLRGLGYQHIYFLRGTGSPAPEGLVTLAEYD